MIHVTYALFDDEEHARAALEAIELCGSSRRGCSAVLHRGSLNVGNLGVLESAALEGLWEGATLGAIGGAVLALLSGPAEPSTIGAFAVLTAVYGGIAGSLVGLSVPDRRLNRMSTELAAGRILLVVEVPSLDWRDSADAAARAYGGRVKHKPIF